MKYLQAAKSLQEFIEETNKRVIENKIIVTTAPNHLFLRSKNNSYETQMERFADDYILEQIQAMNGCNSLVFTNLVNSRMNGVELTYFLYKGYYSIIENGFVYYQIVDKNTLSPVGDLQFSNIEQNIFFKAPAPDFEESSCNALEAKGSTATDKRIVFFIGNLNEERLLFDIERLIVTTTFNSIKHSSLKFHYILSIDFYNGKISKEFEKKLEKIKKATKDLLVNYRNIEFSFEYAE